MSLFEPPVMTEETPDLLERTLSQLKQNLAERPAWEGGSVQSDEESFLLMFLRTERFDPALAADRVRLYWEKKREVFGDEVARERLSREHVPGAVLESGFMNFQRGARDKHGRQVLVINPSAGGRGMDFIKLAWIVMHELLEDEQTQARGVIAISIGKTAKISQNAAKIELAKGLMKNINNALPVRVGGICICYPQFFFGMMWKIVKPFLGERLQGRVRMLEGSDERIKRSLLEIMDDEAIPAWPFGGQCTFPSDPSVPPSH